MTVRTRFAPSPTGLLHLGNARTSLFNYLFAAHHQGTYLVRIEDTDLARSTEEAINVIKQGLTWLNLMPQEPIVFQSHNAKAHQAAALTLYKAGKAYYCQCAPDTLQVMREEARKEGKKPGYNGHCRDKGHTTGALRLRMPDEGVTQINDLIQGAITVENSQLDDFILLRSDGSPTYMLSVVVDDHIMEITHVIRGDDHLTNAFRQKKLYEAFEWHIPAFAHVPLIHGSDGAKFSKRHGAPSIAEYEAMGYLADAFCNYLLRLGWSHGDDEFISRAQAIEWFTLDNVGRAPARFDLKKLNHMNAHYMRAMSNEVLLPKLQPFLEKRIGHTLSSAEKMTLTLALSGLKQRAETLVELAENALFYLKAPTGFSENGQKVLDKTDQTLLETLISFLETQDTWTEKNLEDALRTYAEEQDIGLGKLAQPLRVLLTGTTVSPSIFEIMAVMGKEDALQRLRDSLKLWG